MTTQTRLADGTLNRTKQVWVVMGGYLWKCAPDQIRFASPREQERAQEAHGDAPWTFETAQEQIRAGQVEDAAADLTTQPRNVRRRVTPSGAGSSVDTTRVQEAVDQRAALFVEMPDLGPLEEPVMEVTMALDDKGFTKNPEKYVTDQLRMRRV